MNRRAFSLIELLIVISVIASLAALLLPTVGMVREMAKRTVCASNIRSLGMATIAYATDSEGFLPEAGPWNDATTGNWWNAATLTSLMSYLEVKASDTNARNRPLHCPGIPKGNIYPFYAGQPADHPATIDRLIACAKRNKILGGQPAFWADHCYNSDPGNGRNFVNCCGHKGVATGATSGTPRGGNIGFADGSVTWGAYQGNDTPTTERSMVTGNYAGCAGTPSSLVCMHIDSVGNLDTGNNLILCRNAVSYSSNF